MKIRILLLRRNEPRPEELTALKATFPNDTFEFIRADPVDHLEHDALCAKHGITPENGFALLPFEKPIPQTAMKRGVRHLAWTPDGLKKLVGINPVFEDI